METNTEKTKNLVDLIVQMALEETAPEIETLVGHRWPDDDTWLCLWLAKKFIPKTEKAKIVFVRAGETFGNPNNPSVLHFDTGGGQYDHHGNGWQGSAARLLAEKLGFSKRAGIIPLLELADVIDTIQPVSATSLHYLIEGWPRAFFVENKGPDWSKVQERVFEAFDIIFAQGETSELNRKELDRKAEWIRLPNGIKIAVLYGNPQLRQAAFETGATVAVWTIRQPKGFYVGIQVNREFTQLKLFRVAAALRQAEVWARKTDVRGKNLGYIGEDQEHGTWYLHDSNKLILSGSKTHPLKEEEFTRLAPRGVIGTVNYALGKIPVKVVKGGEEEK